MAKISVLSNEITTLKFNENDYISITDIAKYKDSIDANDIIRNWLRNRNTIEFLGIWEQLNNSDFKPVEFEGFSKSQRIEKLNKIAISQMKILSGWDVREWGRNK